MPRTAKRPMPLPMMPETGWRDWWDGPDPTQQRRAEIDAENLLRREQIRIERVLLAQERRSVKSAVSVP